MEIIVLVLFVFVAYLYEKQRTQKKILTNLIKQINQVNQESAQAAWLSTRNKEDVLLLKEALNLHVKEVA
ncbi:hypothetical protein [Acinetobacter venetianus]|uniref:hypothetical protein n=1 Tax=Acinetobacter venetianus TaxID=52133 RepID=UPI003A925A08